MRVQMSFDLHLDHYLTCLLLCEEMNSKDLTETIFLRFIKGTNRYVLLLLLCFHLYPCNYRKVEILQVLMYPPPQSQLPISISVIFQL